MPTSVSITDFRKDLFEYAEATLTTGFTFDVYKDGEALWEVIPKKNDMSQKADYAIKNVLPKAWGLWKNKSKKEIKFIRSLRNSSSEKEYLKRYN